MSDFETYMYALEDASDIFRNRGQMKDAKLSLEAFREAKIVFRKLNHLYAILDELTEAL